ncbi:Proline racemase [Hartmannibacter diazotrophicus]|uniref:4-hydroxyproline epimerase n=1 Tax=Hartmannibacter diazotrophicus TaxID=1482074 RepID=A0A2C9D2F9_9HYPH|nr:proline racemase family protein [Hartmannibacter diazotrophicus]SON54348.1 Proline racemase [Hartmannibacter diazotrophicus]
MTTSAKDRNPFSIGHVARVTGVAVSTLRTWENQGLITPFKSDGGHRSFSMEDIEKVRQIERLRRVSGLGLSAIRRELQGQEETLPKPSEQSVPDGGTWADFNRIGAKVRALRKSADMSLRELSERTEIGQSHLSMFERGQAFLSPARLSAIGAVFSCSLAELLGGTNEPDSPIVRHGKGRLVGSFGPGVTIEQLTVSRRLMDAEVWTIKPGRESDGFYSHEGEELIYVLDGKLEITLAGRQPEVLGRGDGAYFSSRLDHRWRNAGDSDAVVLWVNTDSHRLGSMSFEKADHRIGLGARIGGGLGEGSPSIVLDDGTQTYRVVETHTGGHPTRILIEPLDGLDGPMVADKVEQFRARHDHLRSLLLQEPRGHAGSFGLVPVQSNVADFGAMFLASYGYPAMCGHAVIGLAKALKALGRLRGRDRFTVEVPAGVVTVHLDEATDDVSLDLPAWLLGPADDVEAGGRTIRVQPAFGGLCYGLIDAGEVGLDLTKEGVDALLTLADAIKSAWNRGEGGYGAPLDAVLFCQEPHDGLPRQFLAIDKHKFDRSPGVTGLAARMAQLLAQGRIVPGERYQVEGLFGGRFAGEVLAETIQGNSDAACTVRVAGRANIHGVTTLVLEKDDPLGSGF